MRTTALCTLLLLGVATAPAAAQTDDAIFGLRAGIVDLDAVEVTGGPTADLDLSPSLGAFFDYGLGSALWGGLYADVHGLTGDLDGREYMVDVGATLKTRVGDRTRRAFFRPGVGVGFGSVDVAGGAQFLTTRGTVEVVVPQAGNMSWSFEGGVYWAPMGDADGADVEFGPGFLLRAGVLF